MLFHAVALSCHAETLQSPNYKFTNALLTTGSPHLILVKISHHTVISIHSNYIQ
jgi:hypothetical protein